jgi:2-furoate---CoA ligase
VGRGGGGGKLPPHAREVLPSLKRPKRVIAVAAVPRSAVGKTLRRTLVAGEYEGLADG